MSLAHPNAQSLASGASAGVAGVDVRVFNKGDVT